jgi:hypothetical protein
LSAPPETGFGDGEPDALRSVEAHAGQHNAAPESRGSKRLLPAALACAALAAIGAILWQLKPLPQQKHSPASNTSLTPAPPPAAPPGLDPNLPLYIGTTRQIAAEAMDHSAGSTIDTAMMATAERFLGRPFERQVAAPATAERLRLDLTRFDALRFVEAVLALASSRDVRTKTEAVDRYSDNVRRLRYRGGLVIGCDRLDDPGLWAASAQAKGYLVDVTQLPRSGQQPAPNPPLPLLSWVALARNPAPAGRTVDCAAEPDPGRIALPAVVPLASLNAILPTLRRGDLFVLVGRHPRPEALTIGIVERREDRVGALLAVPGDGVVQRSTLKELAANTPGTIGVAFLRPVAETGMRTGR